MFFRKHERNNGNQPSKWLGILYGHPYLQGKRAFERSFTGNQFRPLDVRNRQSLFVPNSKKRRRKRAILSSISGIRSRYNPRTQRAGVCQADFWKFYRFLRLPFEYKRIEKLYPVENIPMNQFNAKQRALRSKIRTQLAELVQKQKKLKLEGASMLELEEVSGEMEVLRKELQSVEDSGHTVFVSAKQMLAPKKELSQKQKKISWKKKHIEIRLNSLNKDLKDLEQSSEECTLINDKIAKFQKELSDLNQEQNAVNDLNHTRFLDAQNVGAEEAGQEQDLKKVNSELEELNSQISENGSKLATAELAELKERLHFLELEKESIENFSHDEFLENTKAMKAKRKSQLR